MVVLASRATLAHIHKTGLPSAASFTFAPGKARPSAYMVFLDNSGSMFCVMESVRAAALALHTHCEASEHGFQPLFVVNWGDRISEFRDASKAAAAYTCNEGTKFQVPLAHLAKKLEEFPGHDFNVMFLTDGRDDRTGRTWQNDINSALTRIQILAEIHNATLKFTVISFTDAADVAFCQQLKDLSTNGDGSLHHVPTSRDTKLAATQLQKLLTEVWQASAGSNSSIVEFTLVDADADCERTAVVTCHWFLDAGYARAVCPLRSDREKVVKVRVKDPLASTTDTSTVWHEADIEPLTATDDSGYLACFLDYLASLAVNNAADVDAVIKICGQLLHTEFPLGPVIKLTEEDKARVNEIRGPALERLALLERRAMAKDPTTVESINAMLRRLALTMKAKEGVKTVKNSRDVRVTATALANSAAAVKTSTLLPPPRDYRTGASKTALEKQCILSSTELADLRTNSEAPFDALGMVAYIVASPVAALEAPHEMQYAVLGPYVVTMRSAKGYLAQAQDPEHVKAFFFPGWNNGPFYLEYVRWVPGFYSPLHAQDVRDFAPFFLGELFLNNALQTIPVRQELALVALYGRLLLDQHTGCTASRDNLVEFGEFVRLYVTKPAIATKFEAYQQSMEGRRTVTGTNFVFFIGMLHLHNKPMTWEQYSLVLEGFVRLALRSNSAAEAAEILGSPELRFAGSEVFLDSFDAKVWAPLLNLLLLLRDPAPFIDYTVKRALVIFALTNRDASAFNALAAAGTYVSPVTSPLEVIDRYVQAQKAKEVARLQRDQRLASTWQASSTKHYLITTQCTQSASLWEFVQFLLNGNSLPSPVNGTYDCTAFGICPRRIDPFLAMYLALIGQMLASPPDSRGLVLSKLFLLVSGFASLAIAGRTSRVVFWTYGWKPVPKFRSLLVKNLSTSEKDLFRPIMTGIVCRHEYSQSRLQQNTNTNCDPAGERDGYRDVKHTGGPGRERVKVKIQKYKSLEDHMKHPSFSSTDCWSC